MGRFSENWLALREPADHASINALVRRELRTYFARLDEIRVLDLGCGAGSNALSMIPDLPSSQKWTLIDFDLQLLEIARERVTSLPTEMVTLSVALQPADLAKDDISHFIGDADLITAAAFFDLVSHAYIERLVQQIAEAGAVFTTTLTYDGIVAWLPEHHLDSVLRSAFNGHQRSDKGFGPAAGPDATDALSRAFERYGYRVIRGTSPWILTSKFSQLRQHTNLGWTEAAAETGQISQDDLAAWSTFRSAHPDGVTIVGHEDLIALPPA